jgi:hypothetical protein
MREKNILIPITQVKGIYLLYATLHLCRVFAWDELIDLIPTRHSFKNFI